MGAYDINGHSYGPGDAATYPPSARASLAMLDEMAEEATTSDKEECRAELKDWIDTFVSASRSGDKRRMQMARDLAVSLMDSLEVLGK